MALQEFPGLQALLRDAYAYATSIGEFDVYLRRDAAAGQTRVTQHAVCAGQAAAQTVL
jgi:hypothetical protein